MSIADAMGEGRSVTENSRALDLFTDRHELIRLFASYLNDDPPRNQILVFYGDGGNGKSLLLKYLRQRCCKRLLLETWAQWKERSPAELNDFLAKLPDRNYVPVPAALLDFGQVGGDEQPQNPFYGLVLLQRRLVEATSGTNVQLRFPRFNFACSVFLKKTGKSEQVQNLFANEEAGFVAECLGLLMPGVNLAKSALTLAGNYLGPYQQRFGLEGKEIERLRGLEAYPDLIDELPSLFAQDLNASLTQPHSPPRLVLFFDTHEAFWGNKRDEGPLYFQKDEWLRRLLRELNLEQGIVVVVAGREAPRWAEAAIAPIPQQFLDQRQVGHLTDRDADIYLQQPGIAISDAALRQQLITYARVAPDQVHPLYLGLGVDVVLQAQNQGTTLSATDFLEVPEATEKAKVLIDRLLLYVSRGIADAVHALSACRAFDRGLYFKLGQALNFAATNADFEILKDFSFVWRSKQQGQNWYQIHDLLRRLNLEQANERTMETHTFLEQYYRELGDNVEAIYHINRRDYLEGLRQWIGAFDAAFDSSLYDQCRNLLQIRSELIIHNDYELGRIAQSEGKYFSKLSRHEVARQTYEEAIHFYNQISNDSVNYIRSLRNKGGVFSELGEVLLELSDYEQAVLCYEQAVITCNQLLELEIDDIFALNSKGIALQNLGHLQRRQSKYQEARQSYDQAVETYNKVLVKNSQDLIVLNNKGIVLYSLADLLHLQGEEINVVEAGFHEAIITLDQAIALDEFYFIPYCNKGIALSLLAKSYLEKYQPSRALKMYYRAVDVYDQALQLAPNDINNLTHKANALLGVTKLEAESSREQALLKCRDSMQVFDLVLELAPQDIYALVGKAYALFIFGDLLLETSETEALQSYWQAISACQQALTISPGLIEAKINKAEAYIRLGRLNRKKAKFQESLHNYDQAIISHDEAILCSPNFALIFNNKAFALCEKGDLLESIGRYEQAAEVFYVALETFRHSLEIRPNDQFIRERCAQLQAHLESLDNNDRPSI